MVDKPGHGLVRRLGHVDAVPAHVRRRVRTHRRPLHAARPPLLVVVLAAGATARLVRAILVET